MPLRKTPSDYHVLAQGRGFRWLGPEVPSVTIKTFWECSQGHCWENHYNSIQQGSGCPICSGRSRKTPADYHTLAGKRGFRWLGPEASNIKTKTVWECDQSHRWEARYNDIQQGTGCPVCAIDRKAEQLKVPPASYHMLAKERGFCWLGPEVPNNNTKTFWECAQGHRWEARYSNVQRGTGCPVCAGILPKIPADYYALARERGFRWLGLKVPNTGAKTAWECNQNHRWEARYNDIQQGKGCPFCYGNMPKTPTDYHTLAKERGFRWLGPEVANNNTKTGWECDQGHRWEAIYSKIQQGRGCPVCAGKLPKTPADYYALSKERGFRWLGPEVANNNTKTGWECDQGHRWEARYNDIQQGTGCPVCAGILPKTPADYYALSKERGFRWLGPEVANTGTRTAWECYQSHQWKAPYYSILQGRGCPVCAIEHRAELQRLKPSDYHALADERGFRWIGPEVPNSGTKTGWECEKGHRWEAVYNNIQQGTDCPFCLDMVHGTRVSQVQRKLCEMLGGDLNHPFGRYNIDIALKRNGVAVAVEYDSWFWHAGKGRARRPAK